MSKKPLEVEERIKKNYQAEDGIWLVQQGKVTEAKLLKEAYERIIKLKELVNYNANLYNTAVDKKTQPYKDENQRLRNRIYELKDEVSNHKKINAKLIESYSSIKHAVAEIELLKEEVKDAKD